MLKWYYVHVCTQCLDVEVDMGDIIPADSAPYRNMLPLSSLILSTNLTGHGSFPLYPRGWDRHRRMDIYTDFCAIMSRTRYNQVGLQLTTAMA